ncbi:hypothetical protein E4H12_07955, partial [Candidatus Thorarchaeota archaeon]
MSTVLDIRRDPTVRDGRLIFPRIRALMDAVGRDSSRVNEKRNIPNIGMIIAENVIDPKPLKLENAKLPINGSSNQPLIPIATKSIVDDPIFSASANTSLWR